MATQGGAEDQLIKANKALAEYYRQLSAYLGSYSNLPDFSAVVDGLSYEELLRRAQQDANGTAHHSTAAAVEELHNSAAHVREYAMTVIGKTGIYLSAQSEYDQSADYHEDRAALMSSLLRGATKVPYLT